MILLNGVNTTDISIADRGLQYGDGVFETIPVSKAKPHLLDRHLQRLYASLERLFIVPDFTTATLVQEIRLASASVTDGIIKIIITRGQGGRGYRPPVPSAPSRIVITYPPPEYPSGIHSGITARVCRTRLGINPQLAGMKHLNRLEQVLARSEWTDDFIFEGLMLDIHGNVVEGTMSNILIRNEKMLVTPELEGCGVAGIVRNLLIELCRDMALPLDVRQLSLADLLNADEIYISNSLIRLLPVIRVDGYQKDYQVSDLYRRLYQGIVDVENRECMEAFQ